MLLFFHINLSFYRGFMSAIGAKIIELVIEHVDDGNVMRILNNMC